MKNKEKIIDIKFMESNIQMIVRSSSRSDKEMINEVFYDNIYSEKIPDIKNGVVMDIGAYIGETAILFSKLGASQIYSYEPNPILFDLAKRNIILNRINAEIFNYGLSDKTDSINILGRATNSFGLGKGPFLYPEKDTVRVQMISFNDEINNIFKKHKRISLVKIDAEGFEKLIVPSIKIENLKRIDNIIVECHGKKISDLIEKFIRNSGMNIENIEYRDLKMNKLSILSANWKNNA